MAGTGRGSDSQKQLLSLIRDFAAEKSQGERRVVNLRKQIEKLTSELSEANAELENAKRYKELVEQDLRGFEVQLMLTESSVQTLAARVSLIQGHISAVESDFETLRSEEAALREQFFHNILHMNGKIRKLGSPKYSADLLVHVCITISIHNYTRYGYNRHQIKNDAEVALRALESTLLEVISQTAKEDQEYQAEQKIYENVQQQLIDCERKVSLMSMIVMETKQVQDLILFPYKYLTSANCFNSFDNTPSLHDVVLYHPFNHSCAAACRVLLNSPITMAIRSSFPLLLGFTPAVINGNQEL
ncbi:hypothetical protein JHK82_015688 [Glycine max]|uniref:Uncharacterized protein n=1 Tax=Glycine max TaxID=3847 RepID=A0A0R0JJ21_SOYBN|nr:hypothetical protein JHK85_016081 [Glycine max]KAG5148807.1 hypothetical protein JHK82_015688 [Glycine max]KRH54487.1 hypothetical protein GLYMA_06G189000v4 [Glycine max]